MFSRINSAWQGLMHNAITLWDNSRDVICMFKNANICHENVRKILTKYVAWQFLNADDLTGWLVMLIKQYDYIYSVGLTL